MRARLVLFVVLFIFLASSTSTAEEAQDKKVHKTDQQERGSMSRSSEGADKKVNPIVQETTGTSPKEPPQPPSAPKGLRILTKNK